MAWSFFIAHNTQITQSTCSQLLSRQQPRRDLRHGLALLLPLLGQDIGIALSHLLRPMPRELPERVVRQFPLHPDHAVVPVPPAMESQPPPDPLLLRDPDSVHGPIECPPDLDLGDRQVPLMAVKDEGALPGVRACELQEGLRGTGIRQESRRWNGRRRIGRNCGGKISGRFLDHCCGLVAAPLRVA